MAECEEKKSAANSIFTTSLVPRQLLLSASSSKSSMGQQEKQNCRETTISLTLQDRVFLHHSICQFLELNGFRKTLEKFRREADIEKDNWKNCSLNLEEMFQEHLQMRDETNQKGLEQKTKSAKHITYVEADKRNKENEADDEIKFESTLEKKTVNGDNIKPKKKKESRSVDYMSAQANVETHLKTSEDRAGDTVSEPAEAVKKSRKKKQKDASQQSDNDLKQQSVGDTLSVPWEPVKYLKDKNIKHKRESGALDKDLQEKHPALVAGETSEKADSISPEERKVKSKSKKMKEDISSSIDKVDEAGRGSKKRKKSSSDDAATGNVEETANDDSKCRKIDDSNETNGAAQPPKTPKDTANGLMDNNGREKDHKQEKTKERNGSAEPASAKAFQRVRADEVTFIDEKLRDNSYWAKDGADSGYGAKAQEILGQVRGRDFRHEKTKKKRGTYRGGQIDLHSHSIKFKYDDDDDDHE